MINTNKQHGFTLIELMITLLLSLMITLAITEILISSNRTSVASDGMSQSQETGRFVMSYLANNIREAGLDSINNSGITTDAFISCTDFPALKNFNNRQGNHQCSFETATGGTQANINNLANTGDRLAITTISSSPDNNLDCTGAGGYADGDTILNVFWVEPDGNGISSLFCQGHNFDGSAITDSNARQAIANGVEAMHILYGYADTPLATDRQRNVSRYINADTIPASGWDRVYAVKISLLTRSITDVANQNSLRRYVLLDAAPYLMTDSVSRQVFNSSFAINNF